MIQQLVGALVRALIVAMIIIIPSAAVSAGATQAQVFTFTFAVLASSIVFVEYLVEAPAILEFRFASPYNRLRMLVCAVLALVLALSLSTNILMTEGILTTLGIISEKVMEGWGSPATLIVTAFNLDDADLHNVVFRAASFTFCMGFFFAFLFGSYVWLGAWPLSKRGFNLWPNMPSFTARAGQKASTKILQVAILSIALAITLPYIFPVAVRYGRENLGLNYDDNTLLLYWIILLWALAPAMAMFRAISLMKLALLAENIRKFD
jgi:hypothetical protein